MALKAADFIKMDDNNTGNIWHEILALKIYDMMGKWGLSCVPCFLNMEQLRNAIITWLAKGLLISFFHQKITLCCQKQPVFTAPVIAGIALQIVFIKRFFKHSIFRYRWVLAISNKMVVESTIHWETFFQFCLLSEYHSLSLFSQC